MIIEVRSRRDPRYPLELLESVGPRKQHQLRRLAHGLLAERERQIEIRIDVIAVSTGPDGRLRVVSHIPNAVADR